MSTDNADKQRTRRPTPDWSRGALAAAGQLRCMPSRYHSPQSGGSLHAEALVQVFRLSLAVPVLSRCGSGGWRRGGQAGLIPPLPTLSFQALMRPMFRASTGSMCLKPACASGSNSW